MDVTVGQDNGWQEACKKASGRARNASWAMVGWVQVTTASHRRSQRLCEGIAHPTLGLPATGTAGSVRSPRIGSSPSQHQFPSLKAMFMARVSVSPCGKGDMFTSIYRGLSKGTKHKLWVDLFIPVLKGVPLRPPTLYSLYSVSQFWVCCGVKCAWSFRLWVKLTDLTII